MSFNNAKHSEQLNRAACYLIFPTPQIVSQTYIEYRRNDIEKEGGGGSVALEEQK